MITVTVIVPVYNEEDTVLHVLRAVRPQAIEGARIEVMVVDDGSTDASGELLEAHPELYARLIRLPRNGGKGAAVRAGLGAAAGDFVLFQDADLEYDPRDYARLVFPVLSNDADVVMGSRLNGSPCTRVHYFWHRVGNRLITLVFNLLNNTTFTDIYCGLMLYRRDLVDVGELKTDGWQQHAEILSKAVARARRVYEVPVSYHGRTYAEGKKIKARHAAGVLWTILRERIARRAPPARASRLGTGEQRP